MKKNQFEALRDILFEDVRKNHSELSGKVNDLNDTLNTREKLETKVKPILNDQVTYLQKNFPTLFSSVIADSIKKQIRESRDEVVDAMYPIIGRMIRKYVTRELEVLSERIDHQLQRAFSWEGWLIRMKAWFGGVDEGEIMMKDLVKTEVEEVFIIQQSSGLLIGSYSRNNTLDQDLIAGMLTAIKSFVRDAFSGERQELETIEYEEYKVIINNLKSFYIAVVIKGFVDAEFKGKLDDILIEFETEIIATFKDEQKRFSETDLTLMIKKHFEKLNETDQV